jgi:hypothetical protein
MKAPSSPRHLMEVSDQLHNLAALFQGKEPSVSTGQNIG